MSRWRIGLIGTGWRMGFFVRAAQALPELFEITGVVWHSESGRQRAAQWGYPLYPDIDGLLETKPDYVIAAVTRRGGIAGKIVQELALRNVPVLMETALGDTVEELTAMFTACRDAKIQVAEQYQFQPETAARITVARSGQIGTVYQSRLQLPNGYHAISVHRKALGAGMQLPAVWGKEYVHHRMASPTRAGDPAGEEMIEVKQMVFQLDYGDKQAFNDLEGDQCRAWFRKTHYNFRGTKGEIYDNEVRWMKDYETPVQYNLDRMMTGSGTNLEGFFLRGIRGPEGFVYENPFMPARLSDDEIAVATCMLKMGEYLDGAPAFYSLAEAMQDRYLGLLTEESARTGQWIQAEKQIWME